MKSLYNRYTPKMPECFLFLDTETNTTNIDKTTKLLTFKLGVMNIVEVESGKNTVKVYKDTKTLASDIVKYSMKYNRVSLYAHNAWFDLKISELHISLPNNGFNLSTFYIADGSKNCFFYFKHKKHTLKIINSYNILPRKLASIGESIGYPKLDIHFDTCSDKDLIVYCKRDVEILSKAVLGYKDFLQTMGFEGMRPTLASQGIAAIIGTHKSDKIYMHEREDVRAFERGSYHGGRTEAFKIGKLTGTWYCFDVNSMYPYVMSRGNMPTRFKGFVDFDNPKSKVRPMSWQLFFNSFECGKRPIFNHRGMDEKYMFVAECTIVTDVPIYPIVRDNSLIFPVGEFKSTLSPSEFFQAHKRGHIKRVHRCCVYAPGNPFSKYIDDLYSARKKFKEDGNDLYVLICKLLMNAAYGKFGERIPNELNAQKCNPNEFGVETLITENGSCFAYSLCGKYIERTVEKFETERTNYAIAGEITAASRIILYDLIELAGIENVAYGDTDSVIVNEIGRKRLQHLVGNELGQIKQEWSSDDVSIFGLKDYKIDGNRKIKGVRGDAIQLDDGTSFEMDQWQGFRGDMRKQQYKGVIIKRVIKHQKREYTKGNVLSNGNVIPFRMVV